MTISFDHRRFEWIYRKPTKSFTIATEESTKPFARDCPMYVVALERRPVDNSHGWRQWDNERIGGQFGRLLDVVQAAREKSLIRTRKGFPLAYNYRLHTQRGTVMPLYQLSNETTELRLEGQVPFERADNRVSTDLGFLVAGYYKVQFSSRVQSIFAVDRWDYQAQFELLHSKTKTAPLRLTVGGEPTLLGAQKLGAETLVDVVRGWYDDPIWEEPPDATVNRRSHSVRQLKRD